MKLKLIILVISLSFYTNLAAQTRPDNNVILGLHSGIASIQGYYENQLEDGYFIGLYSLIPFQYVYKYIKLDLNLSYTRYILQESKSSQLLSMQFNAGPVLYYPLFKYLHPYAGISIGLNYLHITTENTNISERTYKPQYAAKAGLFIPVGSFKFKFSADYSLFELSKEKFYDMALGFGIAYNIDLDEDSEQDPYIEERIELDELYTKGIKALKNGNGKKAAIIFNEIIEKDSEFRDVNEYLNIINENEKKLNKAYDLIKTGKLYEAIPLLDETGEFFVEALVKSIEVRSILSKRIKKLEKQAIKLFDAKKYERCIVILKKIELIDKKNKVYSIYYPKALKRYEAIKLLK